MFLSWVHIRPNSGTSGYKAHVVTLPQNVQQMFKCFTVKKTDIDFVHLEARRNTVYKVLLWLKKYNPLYQNIVIHCNRLKQLLTDG